jgi:hypothetical protein
MENTVVFVYNADSGVFNTLTDTAHKLLSPQTYECNLCTITYSALGMRKEWKDFLESLGRPLEFLHRDELKERHGIDNVALPAIFLKKDHALELSIGAELINACQNVSDLKRLINDRILGKLP